MAQKKPISSYIFTRVPKAQKRHHAGTGGRYMDESMLSTEQKAVFAKVCKWYSGHGNGGLLTLGGFAGTGKSTLVALLAGRYSDKTIGFCAFTGKATSVLRRKLSEAHLQLGRHEVTTIHSLLYIPVVDEDSGTVTGWRVRKKPEVDLIVVDEASMVDQRIYDGLKKFEIPMLAVGDHGQLPPVFGGTFSLMKDPDLRLETIHRQAQGSPILALSEEVRRTGYIPRGLPPTLEVQVVDLPLLDDVIKELFGVQYEDVAVLTNTNRERVSVNEKARRAKWGKQYMPELKVGDQVICLKNTDGTIFNGMRGVVTWLNPKNETLLHYYGRVFFEDDEIMVEGPICKAQFNRETTIRDFNEFESLTSCRVQHWDDIGLLFDYGYALTVHKAQGSQFTYVVVVNKPTMHMDFDTKKRALYTAVTRSAKYLVVLQ
jgi:exodeoxyribonuclease-5